MNPLIRKIVLLAAVIFLCAPLALHAAVKNQPDGEGEAELVKEKSQIVSDLEGLETKKRQVSKGGRGSFVAKHYISGPWKGGTAVIDLASDLSFAEIRILDRDQNLQRIYSIQPNSPEYRIDPANLNNPVQMVEEVSAENARYQAQAGGRARSTQENLDAKKGEHPADGDEPAVGSVKPGAFSSATGDIRTGSMLDAAEQKARPVYRKKVIKVRRKRAPKAAGTSPLDTPLSSPQDDYYYEDVVVETTDTAPSEEKVPELRIISSPPAK